jgi:hypothetical protein
MRAVSGSAVFSTCGQYRYLLTRHLSASLGNTSQVEEQDIARCGAEAKIATFIMLNPSTADATRNDPTIRRCIGFALRWQCDLLQVLNLFALRATQPNDMKRASDPVGPDNLRWFERVLAKDTAANHLVVCAWGVHGAHRGQDQIVLRWLKDQGITPLALGCTRDGHPRHPLYAPYSARLIPL